MQIETIRELVKREKIVWSKHFSKKLRERAITQAFESDLKTRRVK